MSENSGIQWTTHTFNPWWGCTRVSPGCVHCYAETLATRFGVGWGPSGERRLFGDKHWNEPKKWDKKAAAAGERHRVFCASMADVFEDRPELAAERARLFRLIRETPHLDWLLLTKRPELAVCLWSRAHVESSTEEPLGRLWAPNVWLGTTAEDQQRADERIPFLLGTGAEVKFVSYEPALGPVDFRPWLVRSTTRHLRMSVDGALRNRSFDCLQDDDGRELTRREAEDQLRALSARGVKFVPAGGCDGFDPESGCPGHPNPRLDWLIVGGESGPGARPFDAALARSTIEQCRAAGVAVFVKQLGARPFGLGTDLRPMRVSDHPSCQYDTFPLRLADSKGGDWSEWPEDLRVREFPR